MEFGDEEAGQGKDFFGWSKICTRYPSSLFSIHVDIRLTPRYETHIAIYDPI